MEVDINKKRQQQRIVDLIKEINENKKYEAIAFGDKLDLGYIEYYLHKLLDFKVKENTMGVKLVDFRVIFSGKMSPIIELECIYDNFKIPCEWTNIIISKEAIRSAIKKKNQIIIDNVDVINTDTYNDIFKMHNACKKNVFDVQDILFYTRMLKFGIDNSNRAVTKYHIHTPVWIIYLSILQQIIDILNKNYKEHIIKDDIINYINREINNEKAKGHINTTATNEEIDSYIMHVLEIEDKICLLLK